MKQATQAYEAGDLARLLEIEKAWRRGQSLPAADGAEASCRELERIIRELRAQASELQRELRAAQQSVSLGPADAPILEAIEDAQNDLEQLETLRDFVTRYRDGKMSLREFVQGPEARFIDEDAVMDAILAEALGMRTPQAAKTKPRPRAKAKSRSNPNK